MAKEFKVSLCAGAYEKDYLPILNLLNEADEADSIELDFKNCNYLTPCAVVLILAKAGHWNRHEKKVTACNIRKPVSDWLQRMDFFKIIGASANENFKRHSAEGRFVTLKEIGGKKGCDVGKVSTEIAHCLFPDCDVDDPEKSGLFDLIEYSVSELANNVRQHSCGVGFVMAQYYPTTDLVRVAIADSGIGILQSFRANGSPFATKNMNDFDAINLALKPKVSCKTHLDSAWGGEPVNAGVGLTILHALSDKTGGRFVLVSGNGFYDTHATCSPNGRLVGTLCALSFRRSKVSNFYQILHDTKTAVGLLPALGNYDNLFT